MGRLLDKQLIRETHRGRLDRVEDLLDKGAAIDRLASDGFTPLMRAAYHGHRELVEMLLRRGADPNKTAADGASALFWACVHGHASVAEMLIAAGANANAARDDSSVLNAAIDKGTPELIQALLRAGASVDNRWFGMDVVQYAERFGRQDLVPILKPKRPHVVRRT